MLKPYFKNNLIDNLSINKLIKVYDTTENNDHNAGVISYLKIHASEVKKKKRYSKHLTHQPFLFKEELPEELPLTIINEFDEFTEGYVPRISVNTYMHSFSYKSKVIEVEIPDTYNPIPRANIDTAGEMTLIHEINNLLLKEVTERIFEIGKFANERFLTKFQKFLVSITQKIKFIKYNPKIKIHTKKRIVNLILMLSNIIFHESRDQPGSFVVVNSQVASLIQEYIINHKDNNGMLYKSEAFHYFDNIGKIGNINIFVDGNMTYDDCRICVGALSSENEIGIKAIINDIDMINTYHGFYNEKKKLCIKYALENVGGKELCKLKYKTLNLNIKIK